MIESSFFNFTQIREALPSLSDERKWNERGIALLCQRSQRHSMEKAIQRVFQNMCDIEKLVPTVQLRGGCIHRGFSETSDFLLKEIPICMELALSQNSVRSMHDVSLVQFEEVLFPKLLKKARDKRLLCHASVFKRELHEILFFNAFSLRTRFRPRLCQMVQECMRRVLQQRFLETAPLVKEKRFILLLQDVRARCMEQFPAWMFTMLDARPVVKGVFEKICEQRHRQAKRFLEQMVRSITERILNHQSEVFFQKEAVFQESITIVKKEFPDVIFDFFELSDKVDAWVNEVLHKEISFYADAFLFQYYPQHSEDFLYSSYENMWKCFKEEVIRDYPVHDVEHRCNAHEIFQKKCENFLKKRQYEEKISIVTWMAHALESECGQKSLWPLLRRKIKETFVKSVLSEEQMYAHFLQCYVRFAVEKFNKICRLQGKLSKNSLSSFVFPDKREHALLFHEFVGKLIQDLAEALEVSQDIMVKQSDYIKKIAHEAFNACIREFISHKVIIGHKVALGR